MPVRFKASALPESEEVHDHLKDSIWNDYLKLNLLLRKEFSLMFHISCSRFKKLMQDIMGTSIPFFSDIYHRKRKSVPSVEVCLLMSMKLLPMICSCIHFWIIFRCLMHEHLKDSIWNDYLKLSHLLGKEFSLMSLISCGRFKKLIQDIMGTSIPFFFDIYHRKRKSAASAEVCLLMSIKLLPMMCSCTHFLIIFRYLNCLLERHARGLMQQSKNVT